MQVQNEREAAAATPSNNNSNNNPLLLIVVVVVVVILETHSEHKKLTEEIDCKKTGRRLTDDTPKEKSNSSALGESGTRPGVQFCARGESREVVCVFLYQ